MAATLILVFMFAAASTAAFAQSDFSMPDFPLEEEPAEDYYYQGRGRRGAPEPTKTSGSPGAFPSSGSGSFASSGSFSGSGSSAGGFVPGGGFGMNPVSGGGSLYPGYYGVPTSYPFQNFNQQRPPVMPYDFYALFQEFFRQLQILSQQHAYAANYYPPSLESNTVDYGTGSNSDVVGGGGDLAAGGYAPAAIVPSTSGAGDTLTRTGGAPLTSGGQGTGPAAAGDVVGAAAVASLSPQGGFGYADVFPDVSSRFGPEGGEFPRPSGQSYGVFTSSSSGTSDINGKRTSFKTATTGVNDNGKVTVYTKHDP